jgi:predicted dehydrogenase
VADPIRWAVAGTGGIAARFLGAMSMVDDGVVVAVGSRDHGRAESFAREHAIERAWGSYEDLACDEGVDVVYVAVPHAQHAALTIQFLAAGRHVLCEKPFALDAGLAEEMVRTARAHGRFLMEAMWSRFLPARRVVLDLVEEGGFGRPLLVEAEFGFRMPVLPEHRLFDRALGGGALLDLGIYPLELISALLGAAEDVSVVGHIGETGVDELVAFTTRHEDGAIGVGKASIRVDLAGRARISCERGWIELPARMHDPASVRTGGRAGSASFDCSYDGDGLRFEIVGVHECLRDGALESPVMPLAESVRLARSLDRMRGQLGLTYPGSAI